MSASMKHRKKLPETGQQRLHRIWGEMEIATKLRYAVVLLGAIAVPIINFYLLEAYTHNGLEEIGFWSQVFNILIMELVMLVLFFVCRSLRLALRVQTVLAMVAGLANYYVYTFRSLPIVPWDIMSFKTAMSVAGNYNFAPTKRVIIVVVLFLLLLAAEHFLKLQLKRFSIFRTLAFAVGAGILLGLLTFQIQNENFQNRHLMYNKLFTPVYMWQVNGFVVTFVMDLPYLSVKKPSGYSQDAARKELEKYNTTSAEKDADSSSKKLPNIIVVMNESFSDLSVLGKFTTNTDYMPYYHSLEKGAANTVTGYLNVSVVGGNTPNTEFEFLTGNSMAFLPQGSIPYQQYIKNTIPALPSYLKTLGYETYAMHPYYASGWDRETVYPLLGFDQTSFIQDFTQASYIRNYVSDSSCVDKIIQTFEQKETDKPAFIFNVTMQNHGGYTDVYPNFTPDVTVQGKTSYSLSSYLSLIKLTDRSLEELISYFSSVDEPTVVVFFGDHQPSDMVAEPVLELNGMTYNTLSKEETDLRYQVPYVIWANYDIQNGTGENTSANYLSTKVFDLAGVPLNAYQNFLKEQEKTYPVISAQRITDADGKDVDQDKGEEAMSDYQKLQYYQLFDQERKSK